MEKIKDLSDADVINGFKAYFNECIRRFESKANPVNQMFDTSLKEKIQARLKVVFEQTQVDEIQLSCKDILDFIIPEHSEMNLKTLSAYIRLTFNKKTRQATRYSFSIYSSKYKEIITYKRIARPYTFEKQDVF
jgi:hypothetical protein